MPIPAPSHWWMARVVKIYVLHAQRQKISFPTLRGRQKHWLVIPELSGKLKGHAQRVPVKTGSVTELVSILGKKVTAEEVNNALKKATNNNESFGYTDEEIVSSDIIGSHFGSVFDATQTEITAVGDLQLVKTVAWYDNEYGFVTQLIRTLEKFAKL